MIIKAKSFPRAGLIGNPSDGYFGKTIALTFRNFSAEVMLYETPELEILPSQKDHSRFQSLRHLVEDVGLYGYYGGVRLLKATVKKLSDYCRDNDIELDERNFTLRYKTSIPHGVGLAGSSAIITACLRALMKFYGINIPKATQANLALAAEAEELNISAGLQDRVAQAYEGLIYMDFNAEHMAKHGHGRYRALDPSLLPPLYIAYRTDLSQCSEVVHTRLRELYRRGQPDVLAAIAFWADLTEKVRRCLLDGSKGEFGPLMNANFDKRSEVCELSQGNLQMVQAARSCGASAKFTGSGGAIIGTYDSGRMFQKLKRRLDTMGIKVIKPTISRGGRKARP